MSKHGLRLESVTVAGKAESPDWSLEQEKLHFLSELIFERMKGKLKTVCSVSDMKRVLINGYKEMSKHLAEHETDFNFEVFLLFVERHLSAIMTAIKLKDAEHSETISSEQIKTAIEKAIMDEVAKGGFRAPYLKDIL